LRAGLEIYNLAGIGFKPGNANREIGVPNPAKGLTVQVAQVSSLWGLILASTKTHRLEARATNKTSPIEYVVEAM